MDSQLSEPGMTQETQETQQSLETQETQQSQLEESQTEDVGSSWGVLLRFGGDRVVLRDTVYTIGSNKDNSIVIQGEGISRKHFEVQLDQGTRKVSMPLIRDLSSYGTFLNGIKIGKNKERSLKQMDKITLLDANSTKWIFYFQDRTVHTQDSTIASMDTLEHTELSESYQILGDLGKSKKCNLVEESDLPVGSGATSHVKSAVSNNTGELVAIKCMEKKKLSLSVDSVQKEVQIMKTLSHDNIISVFEVINTENWLYIVLE